MLANKRIINEMGFINTPNNSIGAKNIFIGTGTPGIQKTCFQKALFELTFTTTNTINAKTIVKAIFPLRLAPPGKKGIKPNKLFNQIKKKIDNKKGMYLVYLGPIFGLAISSLTNNIIGSKKLCNPLGADVTPRFV